MTMTRSGFGDFVKKTYASADPRSLGIFRVALGAVMFVDVLRRYPEIPAHYSNSGWLSNHFMLFRPMSEHLLSVYLAFSSPNEVRFLMQLHMLLCVLLMIGFRTRLVHVLLGLLLVSINSRNILIENGGSVALTVLTLWTAFLPLGQRFSLDAVLKSLRLRRENGADALNDHADPPRSKAPVVSLAVFALLAQWAVIYALNVAHKNGPEWKDGTAVYYLFHQDRAITSFAWWARELIPLGGYKAFTYAGLALEAAIALLLVSPVWSGRARLVAWALAAVLHLSIASVVDLGPFSWAMLIAFIVFVPGDVWDGVARRLDARYPRYRAYFHAKSGFWIALLRVVKRFDLLGHVRFVPVTVPGRGAAVAEVLVEKEEEDDESDQEDEDGGDDESDSDDESEDEDEDEGKSGDGAPAKTARASRSGGDLERLVRKHFVVEAEREGTRFTDMGAVFALARAIPGGMLLTLPLRLPGIHGFVARRLVRAARRPAKLDEYFELQQLPNEPERRAPEPSSVRLALATGLATVRESLVILFFVACGLQVLLENSGVPDALRPKKVPEFLNALVVYPRLFQGWAMFAPSPALSDGRLVVDGVTAEGRRIDPLTGEAPVFEVAPPSARHMNQIWGDFHRRIGDRRFEPYWEGLKDFIRRHHQVVEQPDQRLTAFEAWYVTEAIPAPGARKKPPERRLLFSEGTMPEAPGRPPFGPVREP
jgi:hypothetical protein